MESDFENAKALFGDLAIASTYNSFKWNFNSFIIDAVSGGSTLDQMNPSSKSEFDEFIQSLSKKFSSFEVNSFYFSLHDNWILSSHLFIILILLKVYCEIWLCHSI